MEAKIKSALPNLENDSLEMIQHHLIKFGVRTANDMEFVNEDD